MARTILNVVLFLVIVLASGCSYEYKFRFLQDDKKADIQTPESKSADE